MKQGNGIEVEEIKEIVKKIKLYEEAINTDLNEININFNNLKECYESNNSIILFNKYEEFSKNFKKINTRIKNYSNILNKTINTYEKTNNQIKSKIEK